METILLVEDDTDIHNLIKKILEKEKYKVVNAYSGTEALMILNKRFNVTRIRWRRNNKKS